MYFKANCAEFENEIDNLVSPYIAVILFIACI